MGLYVRKNRVFQREEVVVKRGASCYAFGSRLPLPYLEAASFAGLRVVGEERRAGMFCIVPWSTRGAIGRSRMADFRIPVVRIERPSHLALRHGQRSKIPKEWCLGLAGNRLVRARLVQKFRGANDFVGTHSLIVRGDQSVPQIR